MKNTRLKARLNDLRASANLDALSGMELADVKAEIKATEIKIARNDACLDYVAADAIYRGETLGQFLRRVDAGKNMTPEALQVFSKSYVNVRSKKSE